MLFFIVFLVTMGLGMLSVHTSLVQYFLVVLGFAFVYIAAFFLDAFFLEYAPSKGHYETSIRPLLPVLEELYRLASAEVRLIVFSSPIVFFVSREGLKFYYFTTNRKPHKFEIF